MRRGVLIPGVNHAQAVGDDVLADVALIEDTKRGNAAVSVHTGSAAITHVVLIQRERFAHRDRAGHVCQKIAVRPPRDMLEILVYGTVRSPLDAQSNGPE